MNGFQHLKSIVIENLPLKLKCVRDWAEPMSVLSPTTAQMRITAFGQEIRVQRLINDWDHARRSNGARRATSSARWSSQCTPHGASKYQLSHWYRYASLIWISLTFVCLLTLASECLRVPPLTDLGQDRTTSIGIVPTTQPGLTRVRIWYWSIIFLHDILRESYAN